MGHFPRKGERKVNGEWVMPAAEKPARRNPKLDLKVSGLNTAADRRNWLRRMAGWPVKEH